MACVRTDRERKGELCVLEAVQACPCGGAYKCLARSAGELWARRAVHDSQSGARSA